MPLQIICDECDYILFSNFYMSSSHGPPNGNDTPFLAKLLRRVNYACPNCQNKLSKNYDYEVTKIGK